MLRIVGRRADGYHLLQTVFQFIDRCDQLTFFPRDDGVIHLRNPLPGVPEEEDLTVRAAKILQIESRCEWGVEIEIEKNLPMGGGLGGGSSDAATTILMLNKLWGLGYSVKQLMALGVRLGADIPIFVAGFSAWAEGVGEVLKPIDLPQPWYLIVFPDCHVETGRVFSANELTRNNEPVTMKKFISGWHNNDCLSVVTTLYPAVKKAFDGLSDYAPSRLTGTGACVFAECEDRDSAWQIAKALSEQWEVFVVKGLNRSPLHAKVSGEVCG